MIPLAHNDLPLTSFLTIFPQRPATHSERAAPYRECVPDTTENQTFRRPFLGWLAGRPRREDGTGQTPHGGPDPRHERSTCPNIRSRLRPCNRRGEMRGEIHQLLQLRVLDRLDGWKGGFQRCLCAPIPNLQKKFRGEKTLLSTNSGVRPGPLQAGPRRGE